MSVRGHPPTDGCVYLFAVDPDDQEMGARFQEASDEDAGTGWSVFSTPLTTLASLTA